MTLFELPEPEIEPSLSADQKRTLRQHAALDAGRHPLMGGELSSDSTETCGTCAHHFRRGRFFKCDLRCTGGPATDIRVSWPGCVKYQRKPSA